MKLRLITLAITAATALAAAAENVAYNAVPGSKLQLDGTSTIHDWTVETSLIGGSLEWDAAFDAEPKSGKVPGAKVESLVLVRSLKSGKSSMDAVMQDAMKASEHPKITYRLKDLTLVEVSASGLMKLDSDGEISVSGVTKPLKMPVTATREGGKLVIKGVTTLKMTDHGIKPPAPAVGLGLIKTGDEVKITFEWVTKKK